MVPKGTNNRFPLQQAIQTRSSAVLGSHSWTACIAAQASQLVGFSHLSLGHSTVSKAFSGKENLSLELQL